MVKPLEAELAICKTDYSRFNETVLHRGSYWRKQEEICESVVKYPTTAVPTGNAVGKSFVDAGIVLAYALTHAPCKVVIAAPTNAQLSGVLWSEMEEAVSNAERHGMPLGGHFSGLTLEFGDNWRIEGFGFGSIESKSGRHSYDLLAVIDEASGVHPSVHEAIDSLNPSRRLYTGNPIRPEGKFYEICQTQQDNPSVNVIQISSLESPHIDLERSPFGMADRTFVENARHEYGEDSIWWQVHVLGLFPGELSDTLLPLPWLTEASKVIHVRSGPVRLGVDIAKGDGGDQSMIVARDDTGVMGAWWSNRWHLDELANQVRLKQLEYDVDPTNITFDATGLGADFDNRLRQVGIHGAKAYMGAFPGGIKFANLRSASGWALRRRLDCGRASVKPAEQARTSRLQFSAPVGQESGKIYVPQKPFALPLHLLNTFRKQLVGCRYGLDDAGRIAIERKEDFVKRLKHSPDFLDALQMTFAYP